MGTVVVFVIVMYVNFVNICLWTHFLILTLGGIIYCRIGMLPQDDKIIVWQTWQPNKEYLSERRCERTNMVIKLKY